MIEKENLNNIASLCRLTLSFKDEKKFRAQLNTILQYVEKINQLNDVLKKENISPDISCFEGSEVTLKDDILLDEARFIADSPSLHVSSDQYFSVPKVIENS